MSSLGTLTERFRGKVKTHSVRYTFFLSTASCCIKVEIVTCKLLEPKIVGVRCGLPEYCPVQFEHLLVALFLSFLHVFVVFFTCRIVVKIFSKELLQTHHDIHSVPSGQHKKCTEKPDSARGTSAYAECVDAKLRPPRLEEVQSIGTSCACDTTE